jgi:hypothetical protein
MVPFEPLAIEERDRIRAGIKKPTEAEFVGQITDEEAREIAGRFFIVTQRDLRERIAEWKFSEDQTPLHQLSRYFFDHKGAMFELDWKVPDE